MRERREKILAPYEGTEFNLKSEWLNMHGKINGTTHNIYNNYGYKGTAKNWTLLLRNYDGSIQQTVKLLLHLILLTLTMLSASFLNLCWSCECESWLQKTDDYCLRLDLQWFVSYSTVKNISVSSLLSCPLKKRTPYCSSIFNCVFQQTFVASMVKIHLYSFIRHVDAIVELVASDAHSSDRRNTL